jgi:hypothetical protein
MTYPQIELSEDEFDAQYPLLTNHLNPNASWAYGDGCGCLFETFGEELAFVRRQDPKTVWTLLDGADGNQYLVNGYYVLNRIGYLISTVATLDGVQIKVRIPTQAEPGDEPPKHEAVRFPLGQTVVMAHALDLLRPDEIAFGLARHVRGDWGSVCPEDAETNEESLHNGDRLFSVYCEGNRRFWVITEADRSVTTVLLPEDY